MKNIIISILFVILLFLALTKTIPILGYFILCSLICVLLILRRE